MMLARLADLAMCPFAVARELILAAFRVPEKPAPETGCGPGCGCEKEGAAT